MSAGALGRLGAGALLGLLCACMAPRITTIVVRDARAFEAKQGGTAAAYVTIVNETDTADVLDSISSPRSTFVSAHSQHDTNGFVTMTPLDHPSIPAHDSLVFTPGSDHLMLESVDRDLTAGDQLPLTFWFHRAGPISVTAKVAPYGS